MGASRKLQGEIDLVLKKVQEGVDVFDSIWDKAYHTDNANQKEKFEADLKKEMKKLQRCRDQIKTWIQSSEIKDKKTYVSASYEQALMDARKLIELEMERFKIYEKEKKTKAFSKEGLGQQRKRDPKEKAKSETRDWLNNTVTELESQIDNFEAEIEGLSLKKGNITLPRRRHLKSSITRHKAHIMKIELLLRLLDNDELSPEQVNDVKDFIDDYVERNQDDFDEFDDVDMLYDILSLDTIEALEDRVSIVPPANVKGVGATGDVLNMKKASLSPPIQSPEGKPARNVIVASPSTERRHVTRCPQEFEHLKMEFEDIKQLTNNFSDDRYLGKGGFGKVYRADFYSKSLTMAAVKCLDRSLGQGDGEFWKEIMLLSSLKHENLISLIGFCDERDKKILVYEYAPRRSLDLYLRSSDLSWIQRLKICLGAARGLEYLHNPKGGQQRVLHRDIKSGNILLDENWNAKIADFGLSKYGPANQKYTFLMTNAVGTMGYCDPMYIETMMLTKESDVYSFGVVLFEVLCSRPCVEFGTDGHPRVLSVLAKRFYQEQTLKMIIDDNLWKQIKPACFDTFTKIAYQCLQRDRKERPSMELIVSKLETALEYQEGRIEPSE